MPIWGTQSKAVYELKESKKAEESRDSKNDKEAIQIGNLVENIMYQAKDNIPYASLIRKDLGIGTYFTNTSFEKVNSIRKSKLYFNN